MLDGMLQLPPQSPMYHANNVARYDRQALMTAYEEQYDCRLVALVGPIADRSVALLEDLIYDASPGQDLHVLLHSPGGDGEAAVRLIRSMQARSREVTVVVPDQAKSAATLLALGAHHILMGPTSDLGPVDPQLFVGDGQSGQLVAAKDIIAAVEEAVEAVQKEPNTHRIYASLLGGVDAIRLQEARSALERIEDLLAEALKSNPDRSESLIGGLRKNLKRPLIHRTKSHGAIFGIDDARKAGLPVLDAREHAEQWHTLWRLYAKYASLGGLVVAHEGRRVSHIFGLE